MKHKHSFPTGAIEMAKKMDVRNSNSQLEILLGRNVGSGTDEVQAELLKAREWRKSVNYLQAFACSYTLRL